MILLTSFAYSTHVKRSLAIETEGIGVWIFLIKLISYIAVIYNGIVLIFVMKGLTNIFGNKNEQRDLTIILIFEHALLLFKVSLGSLIDDEPHWVTYNK